MTSSRLRFSTSLLVINATSTSHASDLGMLETPDVKIAAISTDLLVV